MRISLVVNAKAGSMSDDVDADSIMAKCRAAGLRFEPEPAPDAPLPQRLAAAADQPDIEALVVAGGDGTIACAASVMQGRDTPLGLLPLGTMNLLAKDLGLPLDLDEAVATITTGAPKRIDVGEVNGHTFLISSMLGLPAHMAEHREAQRDGVTARGGVRFMAGLARHLWRYPLEAATLVADGTERQLRFHMLVVVNNDFVERAGHILVRAPVDGGQMTLYVSQRLTLWRMLRMASGMAAGAWHNLPGLERQPVSRLEIGSRQKALRVMNDGEIRLIEQPLRYVLHPRALSVIVPRTDTATA